MSNELTLRLNDALARSDLAVRAFARLLAERKGTTLESERGHLNKVRRDEIDTLEPESSAHWAAVLNELSDQALPDDYFVIPSEVRRENRRTQADELRALRQDLEELREVVEEIRRAIRDGEA